MSNTDINFEKFLTLFPEVELPITLSTDTHLEFSKHNLAIPAAMMDEYLSSVLDDELTEYIACFKIPNTESFHAIVYWRAGLMEYEYYLSTYDKVGNLLDKRVISGTKSNNEQLVRSVATIEADWLINVVEGTEFFKEDGESVFNPQSSRVYNLELLANGEIAVADE